MALAATVANDSEQRAPQAPVTVSSVNEVTVSSVNEETPPSSTARSSKLADSLRDSRPTVRRAPLDRGEELGRYVVLGRLGAGGMGEVYSAYDPELDRRVALKVIRPTKTSSTTQSAQLQLLDEARALARLSHPNVVAVHDVGAFEGDVYIAMEFVEGRTLTAWLAATTRDWREIVEVIVAVARGLDAAHAAGLVHRDIKPDNIIIGRDGRVRVLDFGVARTTRAGERTSSSGLVGTPAYMAPEQFLGDDVGPYTDQFSLGVTLYQALWRQRPFAGETLDELIVAVTTEPPAMPPPSEVPAAIRAAVMQALAHDPSARHPSLSAMIEALSPRPRRPRWPWIVAASAIAGVGVMFLIGGSEAPAARCVGFESEIAEVWTTERKQAIAANAPEDWKAIERAVDGYAASWVEHKTAACRATHVTGIQSPTLLERRMACLDTRRRELEAVLVVASAKEHRAEGVRAVSGLRSLAQCDNLAALAHGGPPATLPGSEVRAIEDAIARVHALRLAGNFKQARQEASPLITRAESAGWRAAAARVVAERATNEMLDGKLNEARESSFEAIRRATEVDDLMSSATAWVAVVGVYVRLKQPTEALRWAMHADVELAKAGGELELRGLLLNHKASAMRLLERHAEALELLVESRTLFTHAFGPRHYRVATASGAISLALRRLGHTDRAVLEGEAALASLTELLGERHPGLGPMLNNLGLAYWSAKRYEDARKILLRALALKETELGRDHPSIATSLINLSSLERNVGRFEAADAMWQRAYDLRVAAFGRQHPDVTSLLADRVSDRVARGLDAEALAGEVVARLRVQPDAIDLGGALGLLCEIQRRSGALVVAARTCQQALEATTTSSPDRALFVLTHAARVAVDRGKLSDARGMIERARTLIDKVIEEREVAAAKLAWAAAHLEHADGRATEARREAQLARSGLAPSRDAHIFYVRDLDRTFSPARGP